MAGKRVQAEKHHIGRKDAATDADAETAVEAERLDGLVGEQTHEQPTEVKKIAVHVL